ncbi:hypothetical protein [Rhodothermus bifroesti]|jgi:hypothetical protein|uniref:CRISPR type III-B/RAMP module-associated protein Cmr5 n=1 Tax=Rhodothermus marinus TaxID=29549 RepID=A0A7V2B1D6_RHOMR|nr:hypothetical protein [Rhodothermus bifroesti]
MHPQANPITNLDIRCAEVGRQLAAIQNIEEKVLNEALSVLEEQGPYAMFLYVKARHDKVANDFQKHCVALLKQVYDDRTPANGDALEVVKQLAENLDDLLFARDLLRNALGYARYHLKAKGS